MWYIKHGMLIVKWCIGGLFLICYDLCDSTFDPEQYAVLKIAKGKNKTVLVLIGYKDVLQKINLESYCTCQL